eukprot:10514041-Lingulodinium_polyedra.AAC.1
MCPGALSLRCPLTAAEIDVAACSGAPMPLKQVDNEAWGMTSARRSHAPASESPASGAMRPKQSSTHRKQSVSDIRVVMTHDWAGLGKFA